MTRSAALVATFAFTLSSWSARGMLGGAARAPDPRAVATQRRQPARESRLRRRVAAAVERQHRVGVDRPGGARERRALRGDRARRAPAHRRGRASEPDRDPGRAPLPGPLPRARERPDTPARARGQGGTTMGAPDSAIWSAIAAAETAAATYTASFDAAAGEDSAELVFELGGDLLGGAPVTVCLDDVEVNDPRLRAAAERTAPPPPRVRVNQAGYLPASAKLAALPADSSAPLDWQLVDRAGHVVASGKTRAFGDDPAAGELVHQIDFSSVTTAGAGYRLRVGGDESPPFAIGADVYHRMKYDALAFFYLQRSSVPIELPYAGSAAYVRPPGHPGDHSVACAPEAPCPYRLDVSGGWYDAGDHGKYLVEQRLQRVGPAEPVRDAGPLRRHRARLRRRDHEHPGAQERQARPARRGALQSRVHAAHAGPGRAAAGRDGAPQSARQPVDADPDAARSGLDAALPATAVDRGDVEPGGRGGAGSAPLAHARPRVRRALPDRRRDRVRRRAGPSPADARTRDAGRRHLRRRRARRRALLGRSRALHHHRQTPRTRRRWIDRASPAPAAAIPRP